MAAVNRLAAFLPGGTFLTFTVLAQITADPNRITQTMNAKCRQAVYSNVTTVLAQCVPSNASCTNTTAAVEAAVARAWDVPSITDMADPDSPLSPCICSNPVETCGGKAHYYLTVTLTIVTAMVCFILALNHTSLDEDKAIAASVLSEYPKEIQQSPTMQTLRQPPRTARAASSTGLSAAPSITDETLWNVLGSFTRFKLFDWLRATGSTATFLVLALLTPPVSTCFWPCLPPVISQTIPLLVAFGISAMLAVWNAGLRKAKKEQLRSKANAAAAAVAASGTASTQLASPTASVQPGAAGNLQQKDVGSAAGSAIAYKALSVHKEEAVRIDLPAVTDIDEDSCFQQQLIKEQQAKQQWQKNS